MPRRWLANESDALDAAPAPVLAVTVAKSRVLVHPSGICAMLIPHSDSERGLTTQQSLDEMPRYQLVLFAAVQAVEWGIDAKSGSVGTQQAVAWKQVFSKLKCRPVRRIARHVDGAAGTQKD